MTRAAYIAILGVDLAAGDGRPVLPAGWTAVTVPTTPAPTWVAGDVVIVLCGESTPTRSTYALRGDSAALVAAFGADVMPAARAWRRARESVASRGHSICQAWRWWRCDVTELATQADVDRGEAAAVGDSIQRDGVVRQITRLGTLLPAFVSLPWALDADGRPTPPGQAVITVRALHSPALAPGGVPWTMAGQDDHIALETEPDL